MELAKMIDSAPGGVLLFDGAMGTMVAARGIAKPGELADLLVLSNPQAITDIHATYVAAGSDVISACTFNANSRNLGEQTRVADVYAAAVQCARDAGARWVAGDIGPIGELLDPYGDVEEDEAYEMFSEQARAAAAAGVDLIIIETMSDLNEASIALQAARENTALPVISTMSFDKGGFTFFGVTPEAAAERLSALGASAVGMNCSTGPEDMIPLVPRMRNATDLPLIVQPNAGLPTLDSNGTTVYDMEPGRFTELTGHMLDAGVRIIGGCCGTTPEFIAALNKLRLERA